MPGTFAWANNVGTVYGGTSGSPVTIDDWAGTEYNISWATVTGSMIGQYNATTLTWITPTIGGPATIPNNEFDPLEKFVMKGGLVRLNITTFSGFSSVHMVIYGTDYDGNTQSEDKTIVSIGGYTFATTKYWKTITQFSFYSPIGVGTCDIAGVVQLYRNFNCGQYSSQLARLQNINIGNGTNSTYMKIESQAVSLGVVTVKANATLEIEAGTLLIDNPNEVVIESGGAVSIHTGCIIDSPVEVLSGGELTVDSGVMNRYALDWHYGATVNAYDVTIAPDNEPALPAITIIDDYENCVIDMANCSGQYAVELTSFDLTFTGLRFKNGTGNYLAGGSGAYDAYFIDCEYDTGILLPAIAGAGDVFVQYTLNCTVIDIYDQPIEDVVVTGTYAHLVNGSDGQCYRCIQDHTAVDATHKPITGTSWSDYWELYDTDGSLGGDWLTGKAYKSDELYFSDSTNANGVLAQQALNYIFAESVGAGAGNVYDHKFLYTLTFEKVNYTTYTVTMIMDQAVKTTKRLLPGEYPATAEGY